VMARGRGDRAPAHRALVDERAHGVQRFTVDRPLRSGPFVAQLWLDGRLAPGEYFEADDAADAVAGLLRAWPRATPHETSTCTLTPCRPCRRDETGAPLNRARSCNQNQTRARLAQSSSP
jgi:hypothetical protein